MPTEYIREIRKGSEAGELKHVFLRKKNRMFLLRSTIVIQRYSTITLRHL